MHAIHGRLSHASWGLILVQLALQYTFTRGRYCYVVIGEEGGGYVFSFSIILGEGANVVLQHEPVAQPTYC